MLFFLFGAIILAFPIAQLLAEPSGSLFYPTARFDRPLPMYGIPESKRKKGLYEEAMEEYEKIASEYPTEIKPYIGMIDIAVTNLKDPEWAEQIFYRGLTQIKSEADRHALNEMYVAICSTLSKNKDQQRKIQLKRRGELE